MQRGTVSYWNWLKALTGHPDQLPSTVGANLLEGFDAVCEIYRLANKLAPTGICAIPHLAANRYFVLTQIPVLYFIDKC
jgi:hypothetical protein